MARATEASFDEARFWRLERQHGETLRGCLERTLREAIQEGSLRAGVELPASRVLAADLGVSRGVATDAYAELEAQGYLEVSPRRPPVVADVPRESRRQIHAAPTPPRPPRFDMTPTTPDVTLFPRRQWSAALTAAVREAPAGALDYGPFQGDPTLRARLADELGRTRGVICDPSRMIIVQGTTQGIDLALRVLGERGATRVAVEDPSLQRQHDQIRALGLDLVGQPVDDEGLIVEDLDADVVIVSPAHQFPTGAVLSGSRRRALLNWSRETGGIVIEDDYDAEFRYDREPVRALQGLCPDGVIYMGTVSKTLAPGLRLAWVVLPQPLVAQARATKRLLDDFSPTIEQLAFARMLGRGDYQRQIRNARAVYRDRRDQLVAVLAEQFPELTVSGVSAGLHVLLNLPAAVEDRELERSALEAGVRVEALARYTIEDRGERGLLLGYGRVHQTVVSAAVAALSHVLTPALLDANRENRPARKTPQTVSI
jgi:GntR family transcriptional regulator / MocR family aminotransferase